MAEIGGGGNDPDWDDSDDYSSKKKEFEKNKQCSKDAKLDYEYQDGIKFQIKSTIDDYKFLEKNSKDIRKNDEIGKELLRLRKQLENGNFKTGIETATLPIIPRVFDILEVRK